MNGGSKRFSWLVLITLVLAIPIFGTAQDPCNTDSLLEKRSASSSRICKPTAKNRKRNQDVPPDKESDEGTENMGFELNSGRPAGFLRRL